MEGESGVGEVEVRVKKNGSGGVRWRGESKGAGKVEGGKALRNWIPLLIAATSIAFSLLIVEQCVMKGRWYPFSAAGANELVKIGR